MSGGAHIGFFVFPEASHLGAFLPLADKLAAAGHRVTFVVVADFAEGVRARGHGVVTYAEDLFPLGTRAAIVADPAMVQDLYDLWGARIDRPSTEALVRDLAPDLLLVDSIAFGVALVAFRLEVATMFVSPTLSTARDDRVPPLATTIVPGTLAARLATRVAWARRDFGRRVGKVLGAVRAALDRAPLAGDDLHRRFVNHGGSYPRVRGVPELILCPDALELPRSLRVPGQYHVEACVDLARDRDRPLDLDLDDPRPLVYCAFGIAPKSPRAVARVARAAVAALAARPHLRMLLALGPHLLEDLPLPANVTRRAYVPQLAALAHARVAITHGGLSSVKECVTRGVPMIVTPIASEQPGNAARVAFHGLGHIVRPRDADAATIGRALDAVLGDPGYHARAARMRDVFAAAEAQGRAVRLVEARLPARVRRNTPGA